MTQQQKVDFVQAALDKLEESILTKQCDIDFWQSKLLLISDSHINDNKQERAQIESNFSASKKAMDDMERLHRIMENQLKGLKEGVVEK